MAYEIIFKDGQRAGAETLAGCRLAARTIAAETTPNAAAARLFQRGTLVYRDGRYNGRATLAVQESR